MATEATVQVLDGAVETAGVSIVTTTRDPDNPRQGTIYNPTTFAAGVPVWFHRRHDGKYLALFSKRWVAATAVYNDGPQLFSAHTETDAPGVALIDPTTGTCDGPFLPPGNQPGVNTLIAAYSRGDYLFTVGTKDDVAWLQHFVITRNGGLQLQGEEEIPLGYNLGVYADGFYVRIFGADEDGNLASVRKNWGRIGVNNDPQNQWQYEGAKGWYVTDYLDNMIPVPPGNLPAAGPVSMAKFRDRYYLMVTEYVAGAYAARVYTSRTIDQAWKALGSNVIPLGDDDTYLGGGAYLQPQLVANKDLLADGAQTGWPYVTSVLVESGSDQGILTSWGILSV